MDWWKNVPQVELDEKFKWGHTAWAFPQPNPPVEEPIRITYEVSGTEPVHPDPTVCARMREIGFADCSYGCKVYADPRSNVRVLAHNRSYGCPK